MTQEYRDAFAEVIDRPDWSVTRPRTTQRGSGAAFETPQLPEVLPLTIDEWLARDLPAADYVLGHWLTKTSRAMLVGATGLGKSMFLIRLGMSCAAGQPLLHWAGRRPARVLYIDGEMSRRLLKSRITDEAARLGVQPAGFYALSHEDIDGFAPLNTPGGQACIEALIQRLGGVDLIIFDNIMALILGSMKEEEPWQQILPWVRSLTGRNIGQIWGHHTGHDEGRSYGTKTREWQLDTVIELEAAHRDDTDVSFKLEFTKARERAPGTRADFQTVRIALVDYQWHHEAPAGQRPGRLSPLAKKFLEALRNVLAGGTSSRMQGRPAATKKEWKAECERMGLLDPDKPNSARALFSKNRRELVAAERIACDGDFTWLL